MNRQDEAFDRALSALHRFGLPDILPALHDAGLEISRAVLGGSHSVAVYPPIDSFLPTDPQRMADAIDFGGDTSLYVHIPFCETRCTFCHYAVQHHNGRKDGSNPAAGAVVQYLDALKRELRFWGKRLGTSSISSIYIGGGTPLVLEQDELHDVIRTIQEEFAVQPGAEFCIEGSPLTITADGGEDKLRFLHERGVTRLSFGAQSFDDTVLRYAARGYKRDLPIRAAGIANRVFANWNLDLIQGLYKGSPAEVWDNLQVLADLLPPHLTWYHGRFADRPQGDWYKSDGRHGSFEDEIETLLGRMLIWQGMADLGYARSDGNRFVREHRHVDGFKKIRTSLSGNLLGIGTSAYSHVEARGGAGGVFGRIFRNHPDIRSYIDRVSAGEIPIVTGRRIDGEELLAMSYATGLRNGRFENNDLASVRLTHPDLAADYDRLEQTMLDLGIIESFIHDDLRSGVRLSELGRLFEDETLALFFSPTVKAALRRKALPVQAEARAFA